MAHPRLKYVVALLFVVLSGAILASGVTAQEADVASGTLPDSAESTEVTVLERTLPSSGVAPAIVVVDRDGQELTPTDREDVATLAEELASFSEGEGPLEPSYSEDGTVGLIAVPVTVGDDGDDTVERMREAIAEGLPDGLRAEVTGGPAFSTDLSNIFDGADTRLLIATALVVALLLLVTYRSPWLWIVPLTVVGVGDRVASLVVAGASNLFDFSVDGSTTGITSVLVFGAGTNYALLLIARYREELRRHEDRHVAMRRAWRQAAPAILASSGTVVLALLMLSFAETPANRALGYSGSIGISVAVLYGLVVLPSAMVLFGRRLFWPFVPKVGQEDPARTGFWAKVGGAVVRRPWRFLVVATAGLAALVIVATGITTGLTQNELFRETPEAVTAQETLSEAFPAGFAEPTVVLARPDDAAAVAERAQATDGVAGAREGRADDRWAEVQVVLEADRGSTEAKDTVERLREELGDDVLVGGPDAQDLDASTAASQDRLLIIPLVLAVVLLILVVLLRSVVAAVALAGTVVLSYGSAMGAGWFVSSQLFGFPALDLSVPLFAFIFLVALGVDYNIFLSTRAREEAATQPVDRAFTSALAATGGVITSAGILLAAVFAVLGVLPLITLTQIGIIVGIGVLLDTLVVRSIVVPALATVIGERFWWPGNPRRGKHEAQD